MRETIGTTAVIVAWLAICAALYFTVTGQLILLIAGITSLIAVPAWAIWTAYR
jgi:hypothetical protein